MSDLIKRIGKHLQETPAHQIMRERVELLRDAYRALKLLTERIEQLQAAIYHCACLELVEHNTDGWGRDEIIQWFLKEYTPPEDKPIGRLPPWAQVEAGKHHPDCNYWTWDWQYSWAETDCNCEEFNTPPEDKPE